MNTSMALKSRLPMTMSGFFGKVSESRPSKSGKMARAMP